MLFLEKNVSPIGGKGRRFDGQPCGPPPLIPSNFPFQVSIAHQKNPTSPFRNDQPATFSSPDTHFLLHLLSFGPFPLSLFSIFAASKSRAPVTLALLHFHPFIHSHSEFSRSVGRIDGKMGRPWRQVDPESTFLSPFHPYFQPVSRHKLCCPCPPFPFIRPPPLHHPRRLLFLSEEMPIKKSRHASEEEKSKQLYFNPN